MCRFISFFHNPINGDIAVYDLTSHSKTQEKLKLNEKIWREGHYIPKDNTIECRVTDSDRTSQEECNERLRSKYPTWKDFYKMAIKKDVVYSESIDLRGCDSSGVALPKTISYSLDLSGCDLSGVALSKTIGGSFDLRGCDLKGVTLPKTIGGWLDLRGCKNIPEYVYQKYKVIK